MNSTNRYCVKGINDDESFCMCCGKEDLKRVVWIEDTETGKVEHFGVVCAANPAKAFGLKKEIQSAVRAHDKALAEAIRQERIKAWALQADENAKTRDALYLAAMGAYKWSVSKINGHTFQIPENAALMAACHEVAFAK